MTKTQTQIANSSMPRTGTAVDVSASDYTMAEGNGPTVFQIFVGTGGDLNAVFELDSTAVLLKNLPDGSFIQGYFKEIKTANTTASDIIVTRG